MFEYNLCGKWVELLKEIAPRVTRAAVLRDPAVPAGTGQFAVTQSVAPSVGVDVSPINLGDAGDRARSCNLRAIRQWWSDLDGKRVVASTS